MKSALCVCLIAFTLSSVHSQLVFLSTYRMDSGVCVHCVLSRHSLEEKDRQSGASVLFPDCRIEPREGGGRNRENKRSALYSITGVILLCHIPCLQQRHQSCKITNKLLTIIIKIMHFGCPEFKFRLVDLSRSCPTLSHLLPVRSSLSYQEKCGNGPKKKRQCSFSTQIY